jgi:hypothetical protein
LEIARREAEEEALAAIAAQAINEIAPETLPQASPVRLFLRSKVESPYPGM